MSDIAISAQNIGKKYFLRHQNAQARRYVTLRDTIADKVRRLWPFSPRDVAANQSKREEFWALKDVDFEVRRGEVLGVVGRNGAGKSTLLKVLSRITAPTTGRIEIEGRVASLLEVGTGFHPELTGRENVFLNGAILGMTRREIKERFDEIVSFAEVEKFLDTPVKRYSSGMYVRLAFAVAAHLQPEVLIVDEVLAVGDMEFQKKCIGRMQSVSRDEGRTVLFVSHNLQTVRQLCDRVLLLQNGQAAFIGDPHAGISRYLHQEGSGFSEAIDLETYPRQAPPEGARLISIAFVDEQGQPANRLHQQDSLHVEVKIRVDRPLKRLDIPMAVTHAEGMRVFSETYSDQFEKLNLEKGEYSVRFILPLRFLKLESYFLTVALIEDGRPSDQVDGLPLPEIFNEQADPHLESHRWGVVRLPVEWQPLEKSATTLPIQPAA